MRPVSADAANEARIKIFCGCRKRSPQPPPETGFSLPIADCPAAAGRLTECCGTSSAVRKQSAIVNRKMTIFFFLFSAFLLASRQLRSLILAPTLEGLAHFRLGVNAQRIGNSIDVVEVGNDLDGVQDVAVRESKFAQAFHFLAAHRSGRARHLHGELAQRLLAGGKSRPAVIMLDVLGQLFVSCFLTEILPVRFDSIEAVVGLGDNRGQHFAFGARKA